MSQIKVAVLMPVNETRRSFIPPEVAAAWEAYADVWWNPSEENLTPEALAEAISDADVTITGWGCPKFEEETVSHAKKLKLFVHTGGTVAPFVSEALYDQGIRVISGNELYAESVAEGAVAYMLTSLRRIPMYGAMVQAGEWNTTFSPSEGLLDQTVGLVGLGAIARKLVPMLKPFRAKVMAYDPYVSDAVFEELGLTRANDMETIFSQCRVVSVHLPRTEQTYHIINRRLLDMMMDGAHLINTARGSTINEEELADVLQTGRINAVLDVYEQEPLPAGSRLRGLENVVLLPHMAGPTKDRRAMITLALLEDTKRFFEGKPMRLEISRDYGLSMTNDKLKL